MTVQLELSPELEARLVREAEAHGTKPEEYAQRLLDESLPYEPRKERSQLGIEEFLRAMAEGSEKLPDLPNEAFTRESIYKDHP
ncbi:MAG: hypothetical protein ACR2JE_04430 [Acidobacteriaceae bacterium]